MPANTHHDQSASNFVEQTILETRSLSVVDNVIAFLSTLDRHPERERLQHEIVDDWHRSLYRDDYRVLPAREFELRLSKWYVQWSLGSSKRLTRKNLLVEVSKWFWMKHRIGFGRDANSASGDDARM